MFNNKHFILVLLFIAFILSGLGGNYYSQKFNLPTKISNTLQPAKSYVDQQISKDTEILYGIFYIKCSHFIKSEPNENLSSQSIANLLKKYPPSEGWVVDNLNSKHVTIYKKENNLCPDDSSKRHLGINGDFVAVFKGPIGLNGGIERVTEIRVNQLPLEFRNKVKLGELDFANESELLEALDTIDEFQQ